jgi:hypothetical protein
MVGISHGSLGRNSSPHKRAVGPESYVRASAPVVYLVSEAEAKAQLVARLWLRDKEVL